MENRKSIYAYYKNGEFLKGYVKTKLYWTWARMKTRCYYPKSKDFKNYGGRGISVCDEWKDDFKSFAIWAIDNGYQENLTLDRIDVNKGYAPDNCRWADFLTQGNNKRNNRKLTLNGKTLNLSQWSRITGIKENCIRERLRRGWSDEKTLTTPTGKWRQT